VGKAAQCARGSVVYPEGDEMTDDLFSQEVLPSRGKWEFDSEGKVDCFTRVCLNCANNGKSCTDCKGIEACMKHSSKVDHCPDYRKAEA